MPRKEQKNVSPGRARVLIQRERSKKLSGVLPVYVVVRQEAGKGSDVYVNDGFNWGLVRRVGTDGAESAEIVGAQQELRSFLHGWHIQVAEITQRHRYKDRKKEAGGRPVARGGFDQQCHWGQSSIQLENESEPMSRGQTDQGFSRNEFGYPVTAQTKH